MALCLPAAFTQPRLGAETMLIRHDSLFSAPATARFYQVPLRKVACSSQPIVFGSLRQSYFTLHSDYNLPSGTGIVKQLTKRVPSSFICTLHSLSLHLKPVKERGIRVKAVHEEANASESEGQRSGVSKPTTSSSSENESSSSSQSYLPPSAQPTDIVTWGGQLPPTRRLVLGGLFGLSVILGGNFLGVSSLLLGINEEASRNLRADAVFPVGGFKRCIEAGQGFEFIYPARWVGDQRLLYRAVERAERERSLDLPGLRVERERARRRQVVEPLVAFGPPGSEGELNVSVVVAPLAAGFTLQKLGSPSEAGQRILDDIIAPKLSDKVAVLFSASSRGDSSAGEVVYYTVEYSVKGPTFYRHNLSVYAAVEDQLYTLNAQTPESSWEDVKDSFQTMADSFQVTGPEGTGGGNVLLPQSL
eukprot:jgi/Mesen1/1720/ME000138S00582